MTAVPGLTTSDAGGGVQPSPEDVALRDEYLTLVRSAGFSPRFEMPRYQLGSTSDDELWEFAKLLDRKAGAAGLLAPDWPAEYGGRGAGPIAFALISESRGYHLIPTAGTVALGMAGHSYLKIGTEAQKREWLPRLARGESVYAEGLTEPNAGSDLLGLTTRADWKDGHWVINGQKTYTSYGPRTDRIWVAPRTDQDAPRHAGISLFNLDLKTPGIRMRPFMNIAGGEMADTYFDDVAARPEELIGAPGQAINALAVGSLGHHDIPNGELVEERTYRRLLDDTVAYLREQRPDRIRPGSPGAHTIVDWTLQLGAWRALTWQVIAGVVKGVHGGWRGSTMGIINREFRPRFANALMDLVGQEALAMPDSPGALMYGRLAHQYLYGQFGHGGGSRDIRKLGLAVRGLGFPKSWGNLPSPRGGS
ncbi:MAG: acyl-CoA dehydrogenase family protein [Hyphomicrobiaceae bacterium]